MVDCVVNGRLANFSTLQSDSSHTFLNNFQTLWAYKCALPRPNYRRYPLLLPVILLRPFFMNDNPFPAFSQYDLVRGAEVSISDGCPTTHRNIHIST